MCGCRSRGKTTLVVRKKEKIPAMDDDVTITGEQPVLLKVANGDQKVINIKTADRNTKDLRLGKIKLPSTKSIVFMLFIISF
jgi:GTPase SAR1 family protein